MQKMSTMVGITLPTCIPHHSLAFAGVDCVKQFLQFIASHYAIREEILKLFQRQRSIICGVLIRLSTGVN